MPVEDFWTLRLEVSDKRETISLLSQEQKAELKRQALESLREYSTGPGMSFPAEVLIVSGAQTACNIAEPLFKNLIVRGSLVVSGSFPSIHEVCWMSRFTGCNEYIFAKKRGVFEVTLRR